ncbi:hypothetical protein FOPG_18012 [Fusarium oxysporum f. sp. conglutinans race 2 54008]|uniref:Uncharacterized protein n=1 Tax=Fusarium oxysporum f. sp. conglutinans race 2 54008 TaxID=1089457 RepID=X0H117_FUSOX|nr:hypothetical protein FOPG_18012 [Fusarium oxysporum f. sp. conglutinans race 2 54008]
MPRLSKLMCLPTTVSFISSIPLFKQEESPVRPALGRQPLRLRVLRQVGHRRLPVLRLSRQTTEILLVACPSILGFWVSWLRLMQSCNK